MIPPNLVVTFTLAGDSRVHTKGAARIRVDGRGGLTLYAAENGESESVSLGGLQSLTIRTASGTSAPPASMIQ